MSAERSVMIASTKFEGTKTHITTAATWGELSAELNNFVEANKDTAVNLLAGGMKVTIMTAEGGTYIVEQADNILPEGDFRMMLTPSKNKSGVVEIPYTAATIKELQTKMNKLFDGLLGSTGVAVEATVTETAVPVQDPKAIELIERMKKLQGAD